MTESLSGQPSSPANMFRGNAALTGQSVGDAIYNLRGAVFIFKTGGAIRSSAVAANGMIYFGSSDEKLYAVDGRTGAERWHFNAGGAVRSSPAIRNGVVYFSAGGKTLYAVSAVTGSLVWKFVFEKDITSDYYWDFYDSSPVIEGDNLYIGSGDGNLYAFNIKSGKLSWKFNAQSRIRSTPAVSGNYLVFGTKEGAVLALNRSNGSMLWKFVTKGASTKFDDFSNDKTSIYCSPAVSDNIVVVGGRDGFGYGLDLKSGKEKWKVNHDGSWVLSTAIKENIAYLGSGSSAFIQAVDLNSGKEIWRFKTRSAVFSSITIAGDLLYFIDFTGNIYAVAGKNGREKWCFPIGSRAMTTPIIANNTIYAGADNGMLYALAGSTKNDTASVTGKKAVYYEGMKTDTSDVWFLYGLDKYIRDYFVRAGYELLDSKTLSAFMNRQINNPDPSVIVFSDNKIPYDVTAPGNERALVRKYLNAGGKVVFLGNVPLSHVTDTATGVIQSVNWEIPRQVLGIDFLEPKEVQGYAGAMPTAEGKRWGLTDMFIGTTAISAEAASVILARDEFGRANAWLKSYGGRPGSGMLQFSLQRNYVGPELFAIRASIERGINW